MNFFELTKKRCSYRKDFTDKEITTEELKLILSTAINAPTGCNMQTTQFVVVTDKDILAKIATYNHVQALKTAKAVIICIIDKEPKKPYKDMSFQVEDCSAAAMSILLAITELGYSSVWIDGALRVDNIAEKIGELINLPVEKKVRIILPVGQAAENIVQPIKDPLEKRVSFNTYTL